MLGSLLLCCCSFSLLRLSSTLVHESLQLDGGTARQPSYLSDVERSHAPLLVHDPALLPIDSAEDHFLMDAGSYDEDSVAAAVAAVAAAAAAAAAQQGRAARSSRRCIPHQQSCLGYPLPCCDPCDICYCRFFNAICYCRRVGQACPPRRP